MMQAHPVPYVHASNSLAIEDVASSSIAVLGAREGTNQIQLRAGIDHPADAAQNPIYFPKSSESIDVHGLKARGLQQKFLVAHKYPRNKHVASRGPLYVGNMTQTKRNHALASSRFFTRDKWSILITASHYQFIAPARDEAATVDILPIPAAVAATNSVSPGVFSALCLRGESDPSVTLDWVPGESHFSINSIPDIARRA